MRARKRNPFVGEGLDKRQARRLRRLHARRGWHWNGIYWYLMDEAPGWSKLLIVNDFSESRVAPYEPCGQEHR